MPISKSPAGIPTTNPATQVATCGVRKRGWTRLKARGRSPSRDIANHTRAWPSWKTSRDEIIPIMAPNKTVNRTHGRSSRRSSLTTGAALPSVSQRAIPVSTTTTAM